MTWKSDLSPRPVDASATGSPRTAHLTKPDARSPVNACGQPSGFSTVAPAQFLIAFEVVCFAPANAIWPVPVPS